MYMYINIGIRQSFSLPTRYHWTIWLHMVAIVGLGLSEAMNTQICNDEHPGTLSLMASRYL